MSFFDNGIGIGIIFGGGVGVGFVIGVCICIDIAFGWGLRLTRGLPGLLGVLLLLLLFTFAGTSTIFLRSSFVGFLYLLFFGLFIFLLVFLLEVFFEWKVVFGVGTFIIKGGGSRLQLLYFGFVSENIFNRRLVCNSSVSVLAHNNQSTTTFTYTVLIGVYPQPRSPNLPSSSSSSGPATSSSSEQMFRMFTNISVTWRVARNILLIDMDFLTWELGMQYINFLPDGFPDLLDVQLTFSPTKGSDHVKTSMKLGSQ